MSQQPNLKSSLAFKEISPLKSQDQVQSDQQNLKDLNIIYRKQPDRVANYSKDILQYFDEHYLLENGQNHHKAVSHKYNHQKEAHKHKEASHSESHAHKKVSEDDKSQSASLRISKRENLQKSQDQVKINGQDQIVLTKDHLKQLEYEKHKEEILQIKVSKHDTEESKKNTNKFWQYFHHSTNQLVKHQNLTQDQQIYHPSDQELDNKYFQEQISQIQNWNQKIKGKQECEQDVSKWNCTTLVENIHTGDYFISQCCFEEVQSHKSNPSCFITSQLWKFNFKAQKFQIQTKFLIDVMHGIEEQSLLSNKILSVEENQFCFIKNKVYQNDESFKKCLQLIHNKLLMPSNFEFLKTDKKSYSEVYSRQLLDKFSIDLPEDWPYDLNELEYSFIQNSSYQIFLEKNFNPTKFLKEQYVLIRSVVKKDQKQNKKPSGFLIYSLDNTSAPIVRYQNGEFEEFFLNFFTIIDENQIIFTLKSKQTVYQITYDKNYGQVYAKKRSQNKDAYNIQQDSQIQIQKEEEELHEDDPNEQEDQNFAQNLVIPLQMEIDDEDDVLGGKFNQLYYIENDGDIKLIYPYHFQVQTHFDDHHNDHHNISGLKKEHQRQLWIIQQIRRNIGFQENEKLGVSVHFNENGVEFHPIKREMIQYLEMEQKPKKDVVQVIYCTSDIILCLCKNFENENVIQAIHSFSIKNSCFKENFNLSCSVTNEESESYTINSTLRFSEQDFQTLKEIEQPKKIFPLKVDNRIQLLDKILLNFDWQFNYQNNFQLNMFALDNKEIQIQDSFYLNKRKKGIFFTHNTAVIDNKEFVFDDKYLLLDLYEEEQKSREPLKLIKLFDDDLKDLKLFKYHVSNKCVIFFIRHIARKELDKNGNKKQVEQNAEIGIEFFIFRTISQLRLISMLNEPLLQEDSIIFIPFSLKQILKEKYGEQMKFKQLLQMQNKMEISTHKLTFETVVDHSDPTSQWFPFIYHNKVEDSKYDHYFCFLNIEEISDKLHEQGHEEVYDEINFAQFMQVFKINYYQNENESYQFKKVKETDDSYRNHNYSAKFGGISMFSRCSNWQKDVFEIDNERNNFFSVKFYEQYSARYQIGINLIFDDLQVVEIQEFIVTIDCREKSFFNRDQASIQKIENIEKEQKNSNIQVLPIQQTYLLKSQKYKDFQKQMQTDFYQKERIIPKISNDGNIEGSMIILNQSQSINGIFQLTERIEVINKYSSKEQLQVLSQKLGEYIFVKVKSKDTFSGYFSDGVFVKNIKYQLIKEYENQLVLNSDDYGKLLIKQDQLFHKLKKCNYQIYWYNLIELSDSYNQDDLLQPIYGPLTRQSIKRLSFNNQLNNQIFMCQTAFTKQSIMNKNFDKDESIYWLYFFSKFLISMSLPNFDEIIFEKNQERIKRYFQPRYILMGKSFSHLDLQYDATNILNLQASFIFKSKKDQQHIFLENSPIYQCLKNGNLQKLNSIVKCMGMEKYYDLQYNYLINETILQKAIDQSKFKAVTFIVDYILNNGDEQELCSVLTQDLPQMLLQGKVDLNNFLDLSYEEEKLLDFVINMVKFGITQKNETLLFNLEQILLSDDLPLFGGQEPTMKLIKYEHPFFSKTHLCEIISKENSQNQEQEQESVSDAVEEDSANDGLVQIQFSYIDFTPIIRKIKFDKILGREGSESNGTTYLNLIQEKIKDIKHVDDLFISSLINEGAVLNPSIIEQSTIKRIVELQYARVRPLVKMELYVYIIFFCVPFIYNIYQYGNSHDDQNAMLNKIIIFVNYLICLLTQLLFIVFEIADIKLNGFQSYIQDGFNLFDSSQFVTFLVHISLRIINDLKSRHGLFKIFDNFLQILIIVQATIKILQFMRFHDDFSFLVSMITHVFIDLIPFLTVFSMYVFLFTIINIIMEADFDDGDYKDLPRFLRIFIQSFRNSIGDLSVIQYGAWSTESSDDTNWIAKPIAIAIIWIFWFLNLLGMLIILTNLLISQVGNTYSTVLEQGTQFLYLQKALLNQHIFTIEEFFGYKNQYKIMIFQQPKDQFVQNEADKQWDEIKELLLNNRKSIDEVKGNMQKMQHILKLDSEKQIEVITEKIDTLEEKMDEIIKGFKDQKLNNVQEQKQLQIQSQISENVQILNPDVKEKVENKNQASSNSIFSVPQLFQGNTNEFKSIQEYNLNGNEKKQEVLLNIYFEQDIDKLDLEVIQEQKINEENRNSFEEFLVNQDELNKYENNESQIYKINDSIGKKQAPNQQVYSQFSSMNQRIQQTSIASNQGFYNPSQSISRSEIDKNQLTNIQRYKIEESDQMSSISQKVNLQQENKTQIQTPIKSNKNIFALRKSESSVKRGKSQGNLYN